MTSPRPNRRSFLTGLLAAPLAAAVPGMRIDTEASQIRAWLAANDCFCYRPIDVPVLKANQMPVVTDPSEGFVRRTRLRAFPVSLFDLPVGDT